MNVSLPGHEPLQIHPGRYYLKSLSCDPTESVDEEAYLHEVEREARVFFCHLHFNIMHELDTVDTNLTLHIFQMSTDECKRIDPAYFSLLFLWYNLEYALNIYSKKFCCSILPLATAFHFSRSE